MKATVSITRRRLGAALAIPFAAAGGKAEQPQQEKAPPPGALKTAAARMLATRPAKNISPAFRFIP